MKATSGLKDIVIVGASLAGTQAAQTLRRSGFEGQLTIVGEENHYPYDRPPLSKHFLAGSWEADKLRLRAAADPDSLGAEWRLGVAATGLDLKANLVSLDDGSSIGYEGLILATGASPRKLPGNDLSGVHVLRTLDDAIELRSHFDEQPRHVAIIGAGFIGAEVAATARERGLKVTMIEAADSPMARVFDPAAGMAIAELHRSHGVDVRLGCGVDAIRAEDGRVAHLDLSDGSVLDVDLVVVGIGVVPNVGWLEGSGLSLANGVVCDSTCLAAPGVVAAGDLARWPNLRFGEELVRVEQWDNAVEQGGYVARRLLAWGLDQEVEPYQPVPWFWSDQYDRKIQLAGVPTERAEIVNGSIADQRFVQIYLGDDGAFVGALGWNRPRQAIQARQLLVSNATADEARAALAPPPG